MPSSLSPTLTSINYPCIQGKKRQKDTLLLQWPFFSNHGVHLECLRVGAPSTCSKQPHHPAHAPIGLPLYLPSHYSTSLANLCNNSRETGVDYTVTQAGSFDRKSLSFTLKKLLEKISLSKVLSSQGYQEKFRGNFAEFCVTLESCIVNQTFIP